MSLYDIERGGSLVNSKKAEEFELLQLGKSRVDPRTFDKMIRTVDAALSNLRPSESSQLTWANCASLIGYSSSEPTKNTNHLWEHAFKVFGHQKTTNLFVGGLVRWRISLLPQTWLCMRDIRDEIDQDTGKPITVSTYWINDKFVPNKAEKTRGFSVSDLASKFNKSAYV